MVRGRFAPSPTGELHLGNARTAILAHAQARAAGGRFVLRVEDLDRARTVPGSMARQLAALRAIGVDWDEGPDVGGPHAPYTQSERTARYAEAIEQLRARGRVYPCYCSRAEIARVASAPHGPGDDGPRYPGTCRDLTDPQRAERARTGRKPALRFRVEPGMVAFEDEIAGRVEQDVEAAVGDFVIQRADGVVAYQLAVVVDDAGMRISHVLRADDLLGSTPRQLQLYRALGAAPPAFAHVGLVLGPSGERLSKRDGPVSVSSLLEQGTDPRRIRDAILETCGFSDVRDFRLGAIPRGPIRFPLERLTSRGP